MARVVDELIAADDDGTGLVTMLRQADLQPVIIDEDALAENDPDLLAGPFAHIVVDEAQELTDAQWHMLLSRCPSRSFTIVGDRAQARHGFTESWEERLERVGFRDIALASLNINYRTPMEVMAEAEPVIRAALPDANVPTSVRSSGIPVVHAEASELDSILERGWPGTRTALPVSSGIPHSIDPTHQVADPGTGQGPRVRPRGPRGPGGIRDRHRGCRRPLRLDDPGHPKAGGALRPQCRRARVRRRAPVAGNPSLRFEHRKWEPPRRQDTHLMGKQLPQAHRWATHRRGPFGDHAKIGCSLGERILPRCNSRPAGLHQPNRPRSFTCGVCQCATSCSCSCWCSSCSKCPMWPSVQYPTAMWLRRSSPSPARR